MYDREKLKNTVSIGVIRPERELTDEYIKEYMLKEIKSTISMFVFVEFAFILPVWVILSAVIFIFLGPWGLLPFFVGGFFFVVFFWILYPSYRKAKRNLRVLDEAEIIRENIICEEKIHLSGSDTLDSETDNEYYIRCSGDRYFSLRNKEAFDLVRQGEELLFTGIEPKDYIVAFADYSD